MCLRQQWCLVTIVSPSLVLWWIKEWLCSLLTLLDQVAQQVLSVIPNPGTQALSWGLTAKQGSHWVFSPCLPSLLALFFKWVPVLNTRKQELKQGSCSADWWSACNCLCKSAQIQYVYFFMSMCLNISCARIFFKANHLHAINLILKTF